MSSIFMHKPLGEDPKEWKYEIGLLPSSTNVVFTVESLLLFLKSMSVEVSPNYTELKSLPKYAQFGKLDATQQAAHTASTQSGPLGWAKTDPPKHQKSVTDGNPVIVLAAPVAVQEQSVQQQNHLQPHQAQAQLPVAPAIPGSDSQATATAPAPLVSPIEGFVPTRKVRQEIGGGSRAIAAALFGDDDEEEHVPARPVNPTPAAAASTHHHEGESLDTVMCLNSRVSSIVPQDNGTLTSPIPGFVPTRRVRQLIGILISFCWHHDARTDAFVQAAALRALLPFSRDKAHEALLLYHFVRISCISRSFS